MAKLPALAQGPVMQQAQQINAALDNAVMAFNALPSATVPKPVVSTAPAAAEQSTGRPRTRLMRRKYRHKYMMASPPIDNGFAGGAYE